MKSEVLEMVVYLAIYIGALAVAVTTVGLIAWTLTKFLPL